MNRFSLLFVLIISSVSAQGLVSKCGDEKVVDTNTKPRHCRYLPVDNERDKYCCLWKKSDSEYYCGSVTEEQYDHIKTYVKDKRRQDGYENLKIKCGAESIKTTFLALFGLLILML